MFWVSLNWSLDFMKILAILILFFPLVSCYNENDEKSIDSNPKLNAFINFYYSDSFYDSLENKYVPKENINFVGTIDYYKDFEFVGVKYGEKSINCNIYKTTSSNYAFNITFIKNNNVFIDTASITPIEILTSVGTLKGLMVSPKPYFKINYNVSDTIKLNTEIDIELIEGKYDHANLSYVLSYFSDDQNKTIDEHYNIIANGSKFKISSDKVNKVGSIYIGRIEIYNGNNYRDITRSEPPNMNGDGTGYITTSREFKVNKVFVVTK